MGWHKLPILRILSDKIEKNNLNIAINVLYAKREELHPSYVSKHNSIREKKNILLMNPNGERWHHLAVKRKQLGIISKHLCGFYYLNCFQSFRTKNKLESDKKKYMKINFSVILPWFLKTSKY